MGQNSAAGVGPLAHNDQRAPYLRGAASLPQATRLAPEPRPAQIEHACWYRPVFCKVHLPVARPWWRKGARLAPTAASILQQIRRKEPGGAPVWHAYWNLRAVRKSMKHTIINCLCTTLEQHANSEFRDGPTLVCVTECNLMTHLKTSSKRVSRASTLAPLRFAEPPRSDCARDST